MAFIQMAKLYINPNTDVTAVFPIVIYGLN